MEDSFDTIGIPIDHSIDPLQELHAGSFSEPDMKPPAMSPIEPVEPACKKHWPPTPFALSLPPSPPLPMPLTFRPGHPTQPRIDAAQEAKCEGMRYRRATMIQHANSLHFPLLKPTNEFAPKNGNMGGTSMVPESPITHIHSLPFQAFPPLLLHRRFPLILHLVPQHHSQVSCETTSTTSFKPSSTLHLCYVQSENEQSYDCDDESSDWRDVPSGHLAMVTHQQGVDTEDLEVQTGEVASQSSLTSENEMGYASDSENNIPPASMTDSVPSASSTSAGPHVEIYYTEAYHSAFRPTGGHDSSPPGGTSMPPATSHLHFLFGAIMTLLFLLPLIQSLLPSTLSATSCYDTYHVGVHQLLSAMTHSYQGLLDFYYGLTSLLQALRLHPYFQSTLATWSLCWFNTFVLYHHAQSASQPTSSTRPTFPRNTFVSPANRRRWFQIQREQAWIAHRSLLFAPWDLSRLIVGSICSLLDGTLGNLLQTLDCCFGLMPSCLPWTCSVEGGRNHSCRRRHSTKPRPSS